MTVSAEELEHMRDQTFVWDVELPAGAIEEEGVDILAVAGTLAISRQLNVIRCVGDLQVKLRLISDRSLESYETDIPIRFTEGLEIVDRTLLPDTLELGLEDAVDQVRSDQPIDLVELIRQYIVLNLPMQNLGPETCYNEELSKYAPSDNREADPTWAAIRKTVESWENPSKN